MQNKKTKKYSHPILGIDPGFERLGIAILEKPMIGKEKVIYSECFHTKASLPFPERLALLGNHVSSVIEKYKPQALAIEKLYFTTNQKTAVNVAETIGVIIYEASRRGLLVYEYTPLEVKVAITGYGKATKDMVMNMVPKLCEMETTTSSDDELDAIAIALTAFARERW